MRRGLDIALSALFAPRRFAGLAGEEALQEQIRNDPASVPEPQRPEWIRAQSPAYLTLIGHVRRSIATSLLLLVVAVVSAYVMAAILRVIGRPLDQWQIQAARVVSLALLAWATLSRVGWKIQTFGGRTLPERFNDYWFRTLYVVGICVGALSILMSR